MDVAAVVFDMDGTLVDSTMVVEQVWTEFAERYDVDLAALLPFSHGRQTFDAVKRFLPAGFDAHAVTAALEAEELIRVEGVTEIPGAAAFLAGIPDDAVAVVTSAPRELARLRMDAAGMALPKITVSREDVSTGKPSPEGYLQAIAALDLNPGEVVIFEDAGAGLAAARASGAATIVVGSYDGEEAAGLRRIADYSHLSTLIRRSPAGVRLSIDGLADGDRR